MSNINLGFNFTEESFNRIIELNKEDHPNKIKSIYCSDKEHHYLSARPLYRFPEEASLVNLLVYAEKFLEHDIQLWCTYNSISIGPKKELNVSHLIELLEILAIKGIGIIVADTLLLEVISKCKNPPKVELSTIMRLESPRQLISLKEQFPFIVKMVMHISYNRSFALLKQFVKSGNYCGIEIEVLCNELCGTGYEQGATPCVHRDSCYECHGSNITLNDAKILSSYPFNRCIGNRYKSNSSWLNLFWILPEHFHYYEAIGIHSFKLTGRTASNDFMEHMVPRYMRGNFNGNLLTLWKSIESINSGKPKEMQDYYKINTDKLMHFMGPFVDETIECHSRLCGIDCNYCEDFL